MKKHKIQNRSQKNSQSCVPLKRECKSSKGDISEGIADKIIQKSVNSVHTKQNNRFLRRAQASWLLDDSEILLTRTAAGTASAAGIAVVTFHILSLNEVDSGAGGLTGGSGQELREEWVKLILIARRKVHQRCPRVRISIAWISVIFMG